MIPNSRENYLFLISAHDKKRIGTQITRINANMHKSYIAVIQYSILYKNYCICVVCVQNDGELG